MQNLFLRFVRLSFVFRSKCECQCSISSDLSFVSTFEIRKSVARLACWPHVAAALINCNPAWCAQISGQRPWRVHCTASGIYIELMLPPLCYRVTFRYHLVLSGKGNFFRIINSMLIFSSACIQLHRVPHLSKLTRLYETSEESSI